MVSFISFLQQLNRKLPEELYFTGVETEAQRMIYLHLCSSQVAKNRTYSPVIIQMPQQISALQCKFRVISMYMAQLIFSTKIYAYMYILIYIINTCVRM